MEDEPQIEFISSPEPSLIRRLGQIAARELDRAAEEFTGYGGDVLVASTDDNEVGYLEFIRRHETELRITSLAVAEEYQGRGIGSSLLETFIDYASMEGFERVTVTSSDEALDRYLKLGFKQSDFEQGSYSRLDLALTL